MILVVLPLVIFLLEDWFFNSNVSIGQGDKYKDYNWGPQNDPGNSDVQGQIIQAGGGKPTQPFEGLVIPRPPSKWQKFQNIDENTHPSIVDELIEKHTIRDDDNQKIYLWSSEADCVSKMIKYIGESFAIETMKTYRTESITASDIRALKEQGVTKVRLSVGWWIFPRKGVPEWSVKSDPFYDGTGTYEDEGYIMYDETYNEGRPASDKPKPNVKLITGGRLWIITHLCSWLHKYDMQLVLDIHSAPGGSSYGVSYAGLPSVNMIQEVNATVPTHRWLKPVFLLSKTCINYWHNQIVPDALDFISEVNRTYKFNNKPFVLGFEPLNEPRLGMDNDLQPPSSIPTDDLMQLDVRSYDDYGAFRDLILDDGVYSCKTDAEKQSVIAVDSPLGSYFQIFSVYYIARLLFELRPEIVTSGTQFWIQIFELSKFNKERAELKKNTNAVPDDWWETLQLMVGNNIADSTTTTFLTKDSDGNYQWPSWLALDYHWYQTWEILKGSQSGIRYIGLTADNTIDANAFTCDQALVEYNSSSKIESFEAWLRIVVANITQIYAWFATYFPQRLPTNNTSKTRTIDLNGLMNCTEWAVATSPPCTIFVNGINYYQQCENDKYNKMVNYMYQRQREVYKLFGVTNCYWTLNAPQSGKIRNPWSYQYITEKGIVEEPQH